MSEKIGNDNEIPHQITLEEIGRDQINETLEQLKVQYRILAHNRDMADEDWENKHRHTTWEECCSSNDYDPVELENLRNQIEELEKTKSSLPDEVEATGIFDDLEPPVVKNGVSKEERIRRGNSFDLRSDLSESWEDFCKRHGWDPNEQE
ncbi:MAG: hypothetical protein WCI79_03355 [Candidatus Saccharibacteria bacterium]